ncbi:unnamed protein product [Dracunculus medinensis]|uniref:Proteasome assembly chaperone 3 n=1 Tax=Dracunculus medinensis TaxID=318479 RepID=A0A0N4U7K0_DRAME|nr:unnamed protein product [Dracunculus medinensis]
MDCVKFPIVKDLSFEYLNSEVKFIIIEFENTDLIFLSNISKIGQILQVTFPHHLIASKLHSTHNIEFDTKILLGAYSDDFELLINRLVKTIVKFNRRRRDFFLAIGFGEDQSDLNDYFRIIIEQYQNHFQSSSSSS